MIDTYSATSDFICGKIEEGNQYRGEEGERNVAVEVGFQRRIVPELSKEGEGTKDNKNNEQKCGDLYEALLISIENALQYYSGVLR